MKNMSKIVTKQKYLNFDRILIIFKLDFDHVTAVSSLMDLLLELSNKSIQYGNSMCPVNDSKMKSYCFFPQSYNWLPSSPQKAERIGDGKGLNYSSYISIGVCVVYIDTGSSVPGVPSVSSLMDLLLELSNKSIQYGNSMCPVNDSKMKSYCFFPQRSTINFWIWNS
jgi:hypothetical protein